MPLESELDRLALQALEKAPEARPRSAAAMMSEVQTWLEAETDRSKRHELAESKAAAGRAKLHQYLRLQSPLRRADEALP